MKTKMLLKQSTLFAQSETNHLATFVNRVESHCFHCSLWGSSQVERVIDFWTHPLLPNHLCQATVSLFLRVRPNMIQSLLIYSRMLTFVFGLLSVNKLIIIFYLFLEIIIMVGYLYLSIRIIVASMLVVSFLSV